MVVYICNPINSGGGGRKITVQGWPKAKVWEPYLEEKTQNSKLKAKGWGYGSSVEWLPRRYEAWLEFPLSQKEKKAIYIKHLAVLISSKWKWGPKERLNWMYLEKNNLEGE
jgi:hypothetical protein